MGYHLSEKLKQLPITTLTVDEKDEVDHLVRKHFGMEGTWERKNRWQTSVKEAWSFCVTDSHSLLKPSKSCQSPVPQIFLEEFINAVETPCHLSRKMLLTINCHLS